MAIECSYVRSVLAYRGALLVTYFNAHAEVGVLEGNGGLRSSE